MALRVYGKNQGKKDLGATKAISEKKKKKMT